MIDYIFLLTVTSNVLYDVVFFKTKREKETDEALTRMPKTIDAFYQRIQKKQATEKEQMRKKQDVLEQAREYYGYSVNLGDPRSGVISLRLLHKHVIINQPNTYIHILTGPP